MEKIRVWRTSDGELFEDETLAGQHQAEIDLVNWAESQGICRGGSWSTDMVVSCLITNAETVRELLEKIAGRLK